MTRKHLELRLRQEWPGSESSYGSPEIHAVIE